MTRQWLRRTTEHHRRLTLLAVAAVSVAIGVWTLTISSAATTGIALEAESGTVASPATKVANAAAAGGSTVKFGPSTDGKFTLVFMPDTQYMVSTWPADLKTNTNWIKNNTAAQNIRFVMHLGDLVDIPTIEQQWIDGKAGMDILDPAAPYVISVGNHDMDAYPNSAGIRDTKKFNQYFPITKFKNWSWQSWVSNHNPPAPEGPSDNQAHKFTAGGTDYLVVTLKYRPKSGELAWANQVIAANPTRRVIIVSHDFMDGAGVRNTSGNAIWDNVASKHKNVQFVFSGHLNYAARRVDNGINGNPVWQILSDYQTPGVREPNTYIRLMSFDAAAGTVGVKTYSPVFNKYMTTDRDQFTLTGIKFGPIQ
jgi:hypothetical protein